MTHLLSRFRELVSLTQIHLHRERSFDKCQTVHPSTMHHFQARYGSKPMALSKHPPPPTAQKITPTPPIPARKETVPIPSSPRPSPPETAKQDVNVQVQPKVVEKSSPVPQSSPIMNGKQFLIEPLATPPRQDFDAFRKLHQQLFPEVQLADKIPDDALAIEIKNGWQQAQNIPPVVILSFRDQQKEIAFLKNIAHAISLRFIPARVISAANWEKEHGWDKMLTAPNLKLIIAGDYDLYLQPALMKVYREAPQQGKHYLHQTPLLLLSELSLYLKEPQLKSLLWRAICNEFASIESSSL